MVYQLLNNDNNNNKYQKLITLETNIKIICVYIIYYLFTNAIDISSLNLLIINNDNNWYKNNDICYTILIYFYLSNCIIELYFVFVKIISQNVSTFYYRFNICYYIFYLNFVLFSDIFNFHQSVFTLTQTIIFYLIKTMVIILNINLTQYLYKIVNVETEHYLEV